MATEIRVDEKRERIIFGIEHISDEMIDFIDKLVSMPSFPNKNDLRVLAGIEDKDWHVDTATPIDYYRRIEELYPNFNKGNMVYDYSEPNTHGVMLNVNDLLAHTIIKLCKTN